MKGTREGNAWDPGGRRWIQNYYLTLLVTLDLGSTCKLLDSRFKTNTRCIVELWNSLFHECRSLDMHRKLWNTCGIKIHRELLKHLLNRESLTTHHEGMSQPRNYEYIFALFFCLSLAPLLEMRLKAQSALGLMQQNCSHVERYFLLLCFVICMMCKAHMWMCGVADGCFCDHSGEMLRAGPLLPSQSFLIVPFGASEPEKREGNSDCLCFLLDSSKFVKEMVKLFFMKWGDQYFVVWL